VLPRGHQATWWGDKDAYTAEQTGSK
jgi:hypothetical protein